MYTYSVSGYDVNNKVINSVFVDIFENILQILIFLKYSAILAV